MKIFSNNSRFSYGILLVLLVISITGVFFSLHNQIAQAQAKTPLLAVVLTVISIALAMQAFQKLLTSINLMNSRTAELEQLKKTIQESKKSKEAEQEKSNGVKEVVVNYEAEAKSFIPSEAFKNEGEFLEKLLSNIAKSLDIVQSIVFSKNEESNRFEMVASYAYFSETEPPTFAEGETLPGQVAKNQVVLNLSEVPDGYITVLSGLGKGTPKHLLIVPIINNDGITVGVIELASFTEFTSHKVKIFEKLGYLLNDYLSTIGNSTEE